MKAIIRKVVWMWLFVVHLLLLIVLAKTDFVVRCGRKIGMLPPAYHYKGPRILADKMNAFYERVDGNVPEGSVIVIGDSLVQGLCVDACLPQRSKIPAVVGFGIGGDTLEGISARLRSLKSARVASGIVVEGGINDLLQGASDAEFKVRYQNLLKHLPLGVPYWGVLLFPVVGENWSVSNSRIKALNDWLRSMLGDKVIDLTQELSDSSGALREEFHIGDGLHLNPKGNALFINAIRERIKGVGRND